MNIKQKALIGLTVVSISFGAGFFAKPAKVKTEIREVVKTVTLKEEAKIKLVYRTVVTSPDGTKTETESSREDTNTKENSSNESTKIASKEVTRDIGLSLQALTIVNINDISANREYGLVVKKRVFSNISISALVTTDKKVGLGLGVDF